jgi:hypothetical protein
MVQNSHIQNIHSKNEETIGSSDKKASLIKEKLG